MTEQKSNNEFDSLEAFFHEKLKDGSFAAPPGPWTGIEEELNAMEKEKRRRRFLWFFTSGLVLLGGLASLWFFVLSDKIATPSLAQKKTEQKETLAKQNNPATENTAALPEEKTTEKENSLSTNNSGVNNIAGATTSHTKETTNSSVIATTGTDNTSKRIQLAACSKKANPGIFSKVPYKVIEVKGNDGYIRYFAETPVSDEALATVRNAGFESAFIKKDFSASGDLETIKEEGVSENTPVYMAATTSVSKDQSNAKAGNTNPTLAVNSSSANIPEKTIPALASSTENGIAATDKNATNNAKPLTSLSSAKKNDSEENKGIPPTETKSDPPSADNNSTNPTIANGEVKNEGSPLTETLPVTQAAKTDSAPPAITSNETRTDTSLKKTEAIDSTGKVTEIAAAAPFTPEWAILLLAGPNIFSPGTQSTNFNPAHEAPQITVNAEAKVQFKPIKFFSASAGLNYTQYTVKQGNPEYFLFNKNQKEDFKFYSSFGPMAVPMNVMLDGFYTGVPFDTFFARYTYSSKINLLNIPLEANLHFLNRSRINLYAGVGANTSIVLSQQSKLSLVKENFKNDLSYNNVTVNRVNMVLIFSLGCDIKLGKRLSLTLSPSYRYGLSNYSNTAGTTFKPSYFAGNAGIRFRLK